MALPTEKELRLRFAKWAETWVVENGMSAAVASGDLATVELGANALLSKSEAQALIDYLHTSESNAARRARSRAKAVDHINGDHLAATPPKATFAYRDSKLAAKIIGVFKRGTMKDISLLAQAPGVQGAVSVSADVIFVPSTQSTRYSVTRAAKTNLQRRMPGYEIKVSDTMTGEGLIYFTASKELDICGTTLVITAKCAASQSDMSAHSLSLDQDGTVSVLEPSGTAMSPEEAVQVWQRIAENFLSNK